MHPVEIIFATGLGLCLVGIVAYWVFYVGYWLTKGENPFGDRVD
jgi:hypothetical protein